MKTITDAEKETLFNLVEERFRNHPIWGEAFVDLTNHGGCVPWAACGIEVLREHGFNAMLQAGSLQWPLIKPEEDDGVCMTHLGFVWSPDSPLSRLFISQKRLPEMHVWIAIRHDEETLAADLVDFSTGGLKRWAVTNGLKWTSPEPPKFYWEKHPPPHSRYIPNPEAMSCALAFIARELKVKPDSPSAISAFALRFGLQMLPGSGAGYVAQRN